MVSDAPAFSLHINMSTCFLTKIALSHRLAQELLTATAWHRESLARTGGGDGADLARAGATVGCYQTQDLSLDS